MTVKLSPIGNDAPFLDASGIPLNAGQLFTYLAGSVSTSQTTYTDSAGTVPNANPIVLNSNGYPASGGNVVEIWLTSGVSYKFVLKTSAGVTVWSRDNISGINDTTSTLDQWVAGPVPTFVSTTSFTLVGDQTSLFHVGRRLKTTNSGGTIYSTITVSAFGVLTTITVVNDSGVLDSGLSAVSYGLESAENTSAPLLSDTYPLRSGSADKTKKVRFEIDGLTTATTRVLTVQDSDDTLVGRATTDTLTNKTLTNPSVDTITGAVVATQANQETASATNLVVSPGRQQFHPSAAKVWAEFAGSSSTVNASYNVSSVTHNSAGNSTVTFTVAFSGTSYCVITQIGYTSSAGNFLAPLYDSDSKTTGAVNIFSKDNAASLVDPTNWSLVCFGDQ